MYSLVILVEIMLKLVLAENVTSFSCIVELCTFYWLSYKELDFYRNNLVCFVYFMLL